MDSDYEFVFKSDAEYWLISELYAQNRLRQFSVVELEKAAKNALSAMLAKLAGGWIAPPKPEALPPVPEKVMSPEERGRKCYEIRVRLGMVR